MRLNIAQLRCPDQPQARESVGFSAFAQFFKARNLLRFGSYDDFAGDFVWNVVLATEIHHGGGSSDAETGFQRSRFVVNPRVNDATVVSALMWGDSVFFSTIKRRSRGKRRVISRA